VSRTATYEDHKRRAAEFVNKAVTTALMDGPPDNIEPPAVGDGWADEPYDGQEQFIRTAIEQFKHRAPTISLDTPSADFAGWPSGRAYAAAVKLSLWNKQSAGVTPMAMFVVRHAFWRFLAVSILYRKHIGCWPTLGWSECPVLGLSHPNAELREDGFIRRIHNWSEMFLRAVGVIR